MDKPIKFSIDHVKSIILRKKEKNIEGIRLFTALVRGVESGSIIVADKALELILKEL